MAGMLIYDTAVFNLNQEFPYDPSVRLLYALGAFLFIIIGIIILISCLFYLFRAFKLRLPVYV